MNIPAETKKLVQDGFREISGYRVAYVGRTYSVLIEFNSARPFIAVVGLCTTGEAGAAVSALEEIESGARIQAAAAEKQALDGPA